MTIPKVAAITGANSTLAKRIAEQLAKDGWILVLGSRDKSSLDSFSSELMGRFGTSTITLELDVSNSDSVTDFYLHAKDFTGRIDGIVHTAAQLKPYGSILDVDPEDWIRSIDVNLSGTFRVMQAFSKIMVKQKYGVMTFLSGGGSTSPLPTLSSYAAAKAGVARLVETISQELAPHNIRVNAVAPGVMNTKMVKEMLATGGDLIDKAYMTRMQNTILRGVDSTQDACDLAVWLMTQNVPGLTGRIISAVWDDWRSWNPRTTHFLDENVLTLRRNI